METFRLVCHPDTPASSIEFIEVQIAHNGETLWLRFYVECRLQDLALPDRAISTRADGIWRHTCFETFVGDGAYSEFNFSPSSQWAAYDFSGYREGMCERPMAVQPEIGLDVSDEHFALEAVFAVGGLQGALGLSAVIEEMGGTKSYWALAHPPGAPDFHHPTCFAATLPAPDQP